MNAPESYEMFTLPEGVSKVMFEKDSKMLNTMLFTIHLEDHTVGNVLKMQLLRDEKVRYAGYRKPHPLENKIELRVTTNGEISPLESFREAINSLINDYNHSLKNFKEAFQSYKNFNNNLKA